MPPSSMLCRHRLPSFRTTCVGVGVTYVLLAGGLLANGIAETMARYEVPAQTLASPHYMDAILWVYSHMIVLGLVIGLVGLLAESARLKLWFARLIFVAQCYYLVLDLRSSDSVLGNGLYEGPQSLGPAIIGFVVTLLFLHLSFCPEVEPA